MFACYAFNNGGCPLYQDQCLFAHITTDPGNQYSPLRHPELKPSDAPIAEAAARAGFDCSSWTNLKRLIDAVRAVDKPMVTYPDRWRPAAYHSKIYPDRWRPDRINERNRVTSANLDARRTSRELANNVDTTTCAQSAARMPATSTKNPALPLRPAVSNKRNADAVDVVFLSSKRTKTEPPATPKVIDLTLDDEPTNTIVPSHRLLSRPALANITNPGTGPKKSSKRRKNPRPPQESVIHRESLVILAKIASKLRASAHALDEDRWTLRQRWDLDETLQLQHITDHLVDLNRCFKEAGNGISGALEIIEKRLLTDPKVLLPSTNAAMPDELQGGI